MTLFLGGGLAPPCGPAARSLNELFSGDCVKTKAGDVSKKNKQKNTRNNIEVAVMGKVKIAPAHTSSLSTAAKGQRTFYLHTHTRTHAHTHTATFTTLCDEINERSAPTRENKEKTRAVQSGQVT